LLPAWAGTQAVREEEAIPPFLFGRAVYGDFGSGGICYRRYGLGHAYLQQLAAVEVLEGAETPGKEVLGDVEALAISMLVLLSQCRAGLDGVR
jgi:hypothetical protein